MSNIAKLNVVLVGVLAVLAVVIGGMVYVDRHTSKCGLEPASACEYTYGSLDLSK